MNSLNYFIVDAKCGHVGKNKYMPISFAVIAKTGKEAAYMVRNFPRVKHNHKDAIKDVRKVSYEEYLIQFNNNNEDSYLKCESKQEQNQITNLNDRLLEDNHLERRIYKTTHTKSILEYKRKKENYKFASCYE